MERFDCIIIGAGPGGYVAAIRAAQLGMKAALVEKRETLGGTCLNVGCIPSKALLESSELFHTVGHRLAGHGITAEGVGFDLEAMMKRKEQIVDEITAGVGLLMKKNKITTLNGRGILVGSGRVDLETADGKTELQADHVVLAMGSIPMDLPGLPFDGSRIVSSTEALTFSEVPDHLVVVGAGAIGLELGSVWSRLGSRVTVIELLPAIAPFADLQMSKMLKRSLSAQGLEFKLSSKVVAAKVNGETAEVKVENGKGKTSSVTCDRVLVAVGRKPCIEKTGIEQAGVNIGKGRIQVDERWQTSVKDVFAIGDLIHGPMLAHKASEEGIAVAELMAGKAGHVNYETIPNVVYTWPELAQVGITEAEAKDQGIPYTVGRSYFKANGRAKSLGEEEGLVKILAHAETDRLLGVHILGPRASDLIAEAVTAMEFHGSAEDLARTCHAHPTLSEVVLEAALAVDKRSIHG